MRRPARREVAHRVRRVTAADRVVQLAAVTVAPVVRLAVVIVVATGARQGIADRVRPAEIVTIEIDRPARH
jgi:hypothetical protein